MDESWVLPAEETPGRKSRIKRLLRPGCAGLAAGKAKPGRQASKARGLRGKTRLTPKASRARSSLKLGTDCAGLLCATLALERLGLGDMLDHVFVSESNSKVRSMLLHNYDLRCEICPDVLQRSVETTPTCDVYTCGFPCQPFSSEGLREGVLDKQGRGIIAYANAAYVAKKVPKAFILENVGGLATRRHRAFREQLLGRLRNATLQDGRRAYTLWTKKLNCKYHGVAQSRPRFFIVGVRQDCLEASGRTFRWPASVQTPPLESFLDDPPPQGGRPRMPSSRTHLSNMLKAMKFIRGRGGDLNGPWVADLGTGRELARPMCNVSPCLTASRCKSGGHYLFCRGRFMTTREMMRLQGIDPDRLSKAEGVLESHFRHMIGNSFTVTVMERLLNRVLLAIGFLNKSKDRFSNELC